MNAEAAAMFEAVMENLRRDLDAGFNPPANTRHVTFTLMIAETSTIEPGEIFMVSHISNAGEWGKQIDMAKAFIAKAELFSAEIAGGVN